MTSTQLAPPATPTGPAPAVLVRGLAKSYGGRAVLDRLDLEVRQGECFALLGPNGAGKTTETHLLRVFAELGVDDRTRAVLVAVERGILPGPAQPEASPAPARCPSAEGALSGVESRCRVLVKGLSGSVDRRLTWGFGS